MESPIDSPASSPTLPPLRANSDSSPLRRREEVHRRNKSNASCPEAKNQTVQATQEDAAVPEIPHSSPLPLANENKAGNITSPTYKQEQRRKALAVKHLVGPRKPVPATPEKTKDTSRRVSDTTPGSTKRKFTPEGKKTSPAPKLLTEVTEEDVLRRSHLHSRKPSRFASFEGSNKFRRILKLDQVLEESELFATPGRATSQPVKLEKIEGLSLFDLNPLSVRKVPSPVSTESADYTSTAQVVAEVEVVQLPKTPEEILLDSLLDSPELNASKNPRPNSLYNPSLFSTQHGIAPILANRKPKRKPGTSSPPRVKFTLTSPSPQQISKPTQTLTTNSTTTPVKPQFTQRAQAQAQIQAQTQSQTHLPIAARYITALENTASADLEARQLKKFRRQTSLARLRELTPSPTSVNGLYGLSPSTGSPGQPLTLWISDLCHAKMPQSTIPGSSPGSMSGSFTSIEARNRGERISDNSLGRERYGDHDEDLDDAYAADDDVGGGSGGGVARKAKPTPSEELTVMIDDMLNDLTGRFHAITSEIMAKMDDMGRRIDNLEASLNQGSEKDADEQDEQRGNAGEGKERRRG